MFQVASITKSFKEKTVLKGVSFSIEVLLIDSTKQESGTEIGNSLEFDFVVPPPHS